MTSPAEQARVLLAMALSGAGLAAVYDVLRLMHRVLLPGRIAGGALDAVFGVLCAAGIVLTALFLRVDAFRWYTLLGALLGMGVYRTGAGALMRSIGMAAGRLCEKIRPKGAKKGK